METFIYLFIHSPRKLLGASVLLGTVLSIWGKKEELGTDLLSNYTQARRGVGHAHTGTWYLPSPLFYPAELVPKVVAQSMLFG